MTKVINIDLTELMAIGLSIYITILLLKEYIPRLVTKCMVIRYQRKAASCDRTLNLLNKQVITFTDKLKAYERMLNELDYREGDFADDVKFERVTYIKAELHKASGHLNKLMRKIVFFSNQYNRYMDKLQAYEEWSYDNE